MVIIGAGAAGIVAAWKAATDGAEVTLLEKTNRIGTKILISGGGKCNITHDGPLEEVLRAFRPSEARFIRPACYRFPPSEIVRMLTDRGLRVYTRPDGRIFPVDQTAKDVVAILAQILGDVGVRPQLQCGVLGVRRDGDRFRIMTESGEVDGRALVITTGGSSYPNSGTTGDGWHWTDSLGHSRVPIRAALAPLITDPEPAEGFPGVALRDVLLVGYARNKEVARWRGDLLFTHHGLSGPTTLGITRVLAEHIDEEECRVAVDVCPDRQFEDLGADFQAFAQQHPKKQVSTWLDGFLPDRARAGLAAAANVDATIPVGQLPKKDRNRLIETLKRWPLGRVAEVVLPKGEVVAGGIPLTEVDPQTMMSRVCPGLFLAGEILDVAGPVGGYNLQAAWATGFVAGESAAKWTAKNKL